MERTDFGSMALGDHDGQRIAVCPKCGRHGRVQLGHGGGRMYDHVARALEPAIAGVHLEILEWCEVPDPSER